MGRNGGRTAMIVSLNELEETIKKRVDQWDFKELEDIAGEWFGGTCVWIGGDNFSFTPNEDYCGAFGYDEKKETEEFSEAENERQDIVDGAIYNLISEMCPKNAEVEWNIERIGKIRDALQEVLVDDMKVMNEQEFYPYREIK
jgi:hypothetical protein